jgi:hypothetical protein
MVKDMNSTPSLKTSATVRQFYCAQPQIFLGTKFKFQILKNKKEKKCLNVTAKI